MAGAVFDAGSSRASYLSLATASRPPIANVRQVPTGIPDPEIGESPRKDRAKWKTDVDGHPVDHRLLSMCPMICFISVGLLLIMVAVRLCRMVAVRVLAIASNCCSVAVRWKRTSA